MRCFAPISPEALTGETHPDTAKPRLGEPWATPHTDWLWHDLVVTGPPAALAALQAAACGAGVIPWAYPDLDRLEEDQIFALVRPPDGSPGLRVGAARLFARQLRSAVEAHHARVLAAAGQSRACPLDLHALIPVPDDILRRGPDDPVSAAWLRTRWGTPRALRHVRLCPDPPDRRRRRTARLHYTFWSADWTPWQALRALRQHWREVVFDLRPDYGDE